MEMETSLQEVDEKSRGDGEESSGGTVDEKSSGDGGVCKT
jgi:hypothetical protein